MTIEELRAFDFGAAGWDRGGSMNPGSVRDAVALLEKLISEPDAYQATTDGGWPRCGWGDVLAVEIRGEESGPDCRVQPRFLLASWAGASWEPWYMLSDVRRKQTRR